MAFYKVLPSMTYFARFYFAYMDSVWFKNAYNTNMNPHNNHDKLSITRNCTNYILLVPERERL